MAECSYCHGLGHTTIPPCPGCGASAEDSKWRRKWREVVRIGSRRHPAFYRDVEMPTIEAIKAAFEGDPWCPKHPGTVARIAYETMVEAGWRPPVGWRWGRGRRTRRDLRQGR